MTLGQNISLTNFIEEHNNIHNTKYVHYENIFHDVSS
jgi:hypothetical protein